MLKIYTDSAYLNEQHRKNIFPLLLDLCFKFNQKLLGRFQIVSSLADADIAVVPVGVSYFFKAGKTAELFRFIDEVNSAGKKVWLYSDGDFGTTINRNVFTFRLGGFDRILDKQTFILPSFISDPYKTSDTAFYTLSKEKLPKIGFVGNADGSPLKYLKEIFIYINYTLQRITGRRHDDYQRFFPSSNVRYKLLMKLSKDGRIATDFILRKKYRAGAVTNEDRIRTEGEFLQNIVNNPYTFCIRGSGNFSVRFFETLASGRIPLVISTDNRLPLHDIIDWNRHCVIATKEDYIEKIIAFHNTIDAEAFEQMQKNNRKLWTDRLTREAYFLTFADYFTNLR